MINNTNTQLNAYCLANSSLNDTNSSVKVQNSSLYGRNSSFNAKVINIADKINKTVKNLPIFGIKKTDVTPVITHLFDFSDSEKQGFTSDDNKRYYNPTTNCSAAKPSRHSLAIFMPKICLTNYQRFTNGINTNTSALQSRHKYSVDTIGTNTYDGSSEPNKIPLWGNKLRRLNTVVNGLSPSFFAGDNKLTNCSGPIYHG
ncbi:hypothetical protein [Psychrobacter aquimaris]|uniref:hypothetical protein n=1 Tax=Psychrobacter aquimaris TaxID=292733 RepID=UPI003FD054A2